MSAKLITNWAPSLVQAQLGSFLVKLRQRLHLVILQVFLVAIQETKDLDGGRNSVSGSGRHDFLFDAAVKSVENSLLIF